MKGLATGCSETGRKEESVRRKEQPEKEVAERSVGGGLEVSVGV